MNLQYAEEHLLAKFIAGSHAYGTNTETSDVDHRGIFYIPPVDYWKVNKPIEQVSDAKNDTTYYTVLRFLELASHGNPNILEMLWLPEDCELVVTDAFKHIKEIRNTFITKSVLDSFAGYAYAQIKKAKGQNKLVNNPMPTTKPTKENFCWIIQFENNLNISGAGMSMAEWAHTEGTLRQEIGEDEFPFRPVSLYRHNVYPSRRGNRLELTKYNASQVEHTSNMYRLYYYGDEAKDFYHRRYVQKETLAEAVACLNLNLAMELNRDRPLENETPFVKDKYALNKPFAIAANGSWIRVLEEPTAEIADFELPTNFEWLLVNVWGSVVLTANFDGSKIQKAKVLTSTLNKQFAVYIPGTHEQSSLDTRLHWYDTMTEAIQAVCKAFNTT